MHANKRTGYDKTVRNPRPRTLKRKNRFFFCQRCDLGAQTSVLGFEDGQLVVGLLRLEFPLLAALGNIGHAVLEPLDRGLEFLVLALPKVPAFPEKPNQSVRWALVLLGCLLLSLSRCFA